MCSKISISVMQLFIRIAFDLKIILKIWNINSNDNNNKNDNNLRIDCFNYHFDLDLQWTLLAGTKMAWIPLFTVNLISVPKKGPVCSILSESGELEPR